MIQSFEKKIHDNFSSLIQENDIDDDVFAIGVSGGADSLALVYILDSWARQHKKKIVALTVEHGLRKTSKDEALYVSELMKKADIEHHILEWKGKKPITGIEEAARLARYNLLEYFCNKNNIKNLIVAHHKLDQAETFLMRLQRGSGVDGLSAMSDISIMGSVNLLRPLLDILPSQLKEYLKEIDVKWKEDESNSSEDFLRVRVRNLVPYLDEKMGLSIDRIVNTAKVMARTKDFFEKQVQGFVKNNVKFVDDKVAKISIQLLQSQHEEMLFRIISYLLKTIADKNYIPRANDVQRLCDSIVVDGKNFKNKTLGSCEIINSNNYLWIIPEIKDNIVIAKKEWEDFLINNPKYSKLKLPYKVRKFLYMKYK